MELQHHRGLSSCYPDLVVGAGRRVGGGDWEQITDPHDFESLECCVVPGEFAVAENGAVWLTHEAIPLRAALFVTQHLMLVVPADHIVQNMHEAYERISFDEAQFGIFISGPSKTADIEQSLVIGAHGARSLTVLLVDELTDSTSPHRFGDADLWRLAACSLWTETLMQLRLVTYNIHKGIGGVDRLYRPDRVVEAIQHCAPDIVLMQEVDEDVPRSHQHRQVDVLGDALELPHRAYQANVRLKKGHYGNAILSRFPLTDVQNLELTVPLKKRRRALVAHCRVRSDQHTRTLLLFNVHLGLAGFERTIQLRRVLASEVLTHTRQDTGVIVAGDYNDVWGTLGRRVLEPAGFKAACFRRRTFPAVLPMRPLDRVYYRGLLEVDHSFASRTGDGAASVRSSAFSGRLPYSRAVTRYPRRPKMPTPQHRRQSLLPPGQARRRAEKSDARNDAHGAECSWPVVTPTGTSPAEVYAVV